jgi:hypothetical protein
MMMMLAERHGNIIVVEVEQLKGCRVTTTIAQFYDWCQSAGNDSTTERTVQFCEGINR